MIPAVIERWHAMLEARDPARLEALLSDDVVFQSPVVHTPQKGRAITTMYLNAAFEVLNTPAFRYVGQWYGPQSAVLEFETEVDGILVNGVDIVEWGPDERIRRFKVMVRPLKAISALHERMAATLQRMAGQQGGAR